MDTDKAPPSIEYFSTPERDARLRLALYVLHDTDDILYIRAADKSGKTSFATHIQTRLSNEYTTLWLFPSNPEALLDEVAERLGILPGMGVWPDDIMRLAQEGKNLLVMVDDAHRLSEEAVTRLFELYDCGARLLLIGMGALARKDFDPEPRYIDLPSLTEGQSVTFLRTCGLVDVAHYTDHSLKQLHQMAGGLPGRLIEAVAQFHGQPNKKRPSVWFANYLKRPLWLGLAIVMLLLVGIGFVIEYFSSSADMSAEIVRPEKSLLAPPKRPPLVDLVVEKPKQEKMLPQITEPIPVNKPIQQAANAEKSLLPVERPKVVGIGEVAAEKKPTPAATVPKTTMPVLPKPKPQVVVKPKENLPAKQASYLRSEAWIREQHTKNYTLQLTGGRDLKLIQGMLQNYPLAQPHAIFKRSLNGKPWYSLIAGSYPSRKQAQAAQAGFPLAYNARKSWPRSFASIHKQLEPK